MLDGADTETARAAGLGYYIGRAGREAPPEENRSSRASAIAAVLARPQYGDGQPAPACGGAVDAAVRKYAACLPTGMHRGVCVAVPLRLRVPPPRAGARARSSAEQRSPTPCARAPASRPPLA
jgi:hypothetical protein